MPDHWIRASKGKGPSAWQPPVLAPRPAEERLRPTIQGPLTDRRGRSRLPSTMPAWIAVSVSVVALGLTIVANALSSDRVTELSTKSVCLQWDTLVLDHPTTAPAILDNAAAIASNSTDLLGTRVPITAGCGSAEQIRHGIPRRNAARFSVTKTASSP